MNNFKISDSDKRLLIIFFAVLIIAASYFLVFNKQMKRAAAVEEENITNQQTVQELEMMVAREDEVKQNTIDLNHKREELMAQYPSNMTTEKVIENLQDIEDRTGVHFSEITFLIANPLGGTDASAAAPAEDSSTDEVVDTGDTAAETTDTTTETTLATNVTGWYASMGVRYEASYQQLKDMLAYVETLYNRTNISTTTATLDTETGNLTGDITINMFYMLGQDDKLYIEPDFGTIPRGKNNIFGASN